MYLNTNKNLLNEIALIVFLCLFEGFLFWVKSDNFVVIIMHLVILYAVIMKIYGIIFNKYPFIKIDNDEIAWSDTGMFPKRVSIGSLSKVMLNHGYDYDEVLLVTCGGSCFKIPNTCLRPNIDDAYKNLVFHVEQRGVRVYDSSEGMWGKM